MRKPPKQRTLKQKTASTRRFLRMRKKAYLENEAKLMSLAYISSLIKDLPSGPLLDSGKKEIEWMIEYLSYENLYAQVSILENTETLLALNNLVALQRKYAKKVTKT